MPLKFEKMHACGDDFLVVDARGSVNPITSEIAKRLGDRNRGVGFNQLAVILDCNDADARILFWNPNGSTLDACGSATRGIGDMLMHEADTPLVTLRTNRGLLTCKRHGAEAVSVDMGPPLLGWQDIPLARQMETVILPIPGDPTACSMGNPHCTFFVDDISAVDIAAIGPTIESDPLFPQKTNVHFVQILDRRSIRLRIWERGAGIPLGSGSCSCGAVVGGIRRGLLDSHVEVQCDGGSVMVDWDGKGSVFLTGIVERVYSGVIYDV